jgi:hypothetical protein
MSRLTLAQVKASSIPQAIGIGACDPRFITTLNEAQERLANAGKWWGTYKRLRICVTANCITWPRDVKVVEGFIQCGLSLPIANGWYDFQENVRSPSVGGCACDGSMLLDRGVVCQSRDFTTPSKIRLYPASATDVGKRILIQGLDQNGVPVRTLDGSTWVDGEYLTLASPFVTSTFTYSAPSLSGVQKPLTNSRVLAYSVAADSGNETQIAIWDSSERNPSYRRSYLTNLAKLCGDDSTTSNCNSCRDDGDGCSPAMEDCSNIVADTIVRLEFVPVVVDSDWCFIGNIGALKCAMKCLVKEDKNLAQESMIDWSMAIKLLRSELDAYSPPDQIAVNVQVMGTAPLGRIFGGMI